MNELFAFSLLLTRLVHFSGLLAVLMILIYDTSKRGVKVYISIQAAPFLVVLLLAFLVVFLDPKYLPAREFGVVLNAAYGAFFWLIAWSNAKKALLR